MDSPCSGPSLNHTVPSAAPSYAYSGLSNPQSPPLSEMGEAGPTRGMMGGEQPERSEQREPTRGGDRGRRTRCRSGWKGAKERGGTTSACQSSSERSGCAPGVISNLYFMQKGPLRPYLDFQNNFIQNRKPQMTLDCKKKMFKKENCIDCFEHFNTV